MKTLMNKFLLICFGILFLMPMDAGATVTKCSDIQSISGKDVSGGNAGYESSGEQCFSGGGSSFCAGGAAFTHTFECAGATYVGEDDIAWPPFEPDEDLSDADKLSYFTMSTRDATRGRAGHNVPLFMNAHGVCRSIDNTAASMAPMFMGVLTAAEWRSVHGSTGDPNTGFANYANNASLGVSMEVCCSPITVNVCGVNVSTGYANVGTVVSLMGNGGYAEYRCASNNNFVPQYVTGICGGGGGGESGGLTGASGGYSNPDTGGHISADDWGGMSAAAQSSLSDAGYGPNSSVDATNAQGAADKAAAEAEVAAEEAAAEAAKAAEEAAIAAAEAAAAEAEAAAEDDSDDDDGL